VAASWRVRSVRPPGSGIGSSNSRDQPRLLMAPALLVEFGLKALRHPRIVVARVAAWTRSAGGAAGAGVLTLPWFIGVAFRNPAAVLAEGAFHGLAGLSGLLPRFTPGVNWKGLKRPPGKIRRPTGLKMRAFEMAPSAPVMGDLHWRAKGANQNCRSVKGTKNLLRRGHTTRAMQR
jgi:hypothetical protein